MSVISSNLLSGHGFAVRSLRGYLRVLVGTAQGHRLLHHSSISCAKKQSFPEQEGKHLPYGKEGTGTQNTA